VDVLSKHFVSLYTALYIYLRKIKISPVVVGSLIQLYIWNWMWKVIN